MAANYLFTFSSQQLRLVSPLRPPINVRNRSKLLVNKILNRQQKKQSVQPCQQLMENLPFSTHLQQFTQNINCLEPIPQQNLPGLSNGCKRRFPKSLRDFCLASNEDPAQHESMTEYFLGKISPTEISLRRDGQGMQIRPSPKVSLPKSDRKLPKVFKVGCKSECRPRSLSAMPCSSEKKRLLNTSTCMQKQTRQLLMDEPTVSFSALDSLGLKDKLRLRIHKLKGL